MEKTNIDFSEEIKKLIQKTETVEKQENNSKTDWLEYINNLTELGKQLRAFANNENYSTCFTKAISYLNKADEKCDYLFKEEKSVDRKKIVLAKAECNKWISNIYLGWGHSEMAIMYATNVINILQEEFDVNNENVRVGYDNINAILAYFKKPKEGLEFATKHLNMCKKVYGEQSLEVSQQLSTVGHIYRSINDFEKCIEYFKKSLQIKEAILEPTDVELAKGYYNLGYVFADTSEIEKSVEYYKKALEVYKAASGEDSEDVIDTLQAVAYQCVRIGELIEAENYFNIASNTLINKYGENSEKLIPLYCNTGVFLKRQRNYDKVIEVFIKAEKLVEEHGLLNEYDLVFIKSQIGYAYMNRGKYKIGQDYLEDALKIGKEHYKINELAEIEVLESVYYCMFQLEEDLNDCIGCINKIIKLKEKVHGEDTSETDVNKYNLGILYYDNNKNEKSLACFEELLTTLNSRDVVDKQLVIDVYIKMSEVYFYDENNEKGFECLEESMSIAKKLKEQDKLVVENIFISMAEKYYALGEEEKALEYFNKAIKHKVKHEGEISRNLYILNNNIASCFVERGNKDLAKTYLNEANNIHVKLYNTLPLDNLVLTRNYGLLFLNKDEYLEAVKILEVFLKLDNKAVFNSAYYGQVIKMIDFIETKFQVSANAFGREVLLKQMAIFAEKRLELLEMAVNKDYSQIAECCCTIGYAYYELKDSAKVLEYGLKEYETLEKHVSHDTHRLASALVSIGCAYDEETTYEGNLKCLDYNIQAFKLDQNFDLISSNIAGLYVDTDNFIQAEKFMELALMSAHDRGPRYEHKVAEMESNYTNVYVAWYQKDKSEEHFNSAVEHFNNSLAIYEELSVEGHLNIANCFNHELAELHVHLGKLFVEKGIHLQNVESLDEAVEYLNKAKEYFLNVYDENNVDLANVHICLGKAYIYKGLFEVRQDFFKLALVNLEKALDIRKNEYSDNHPNVLEVYGLLALGHYKKAEVRFVDCNYDKVIEYGKLGLKGEILHYGKDSFRLIEIYEFLSEVYKSVGNFEHHAKMINEADRIRNLNLNS